MRYAFAFTTLLMMTALTGPAYSQFSSGKEKTPLDLKYEREDAERAQNEKDYNATMKRLKGQQAGPVSNDPWKKVRSSGSTGSSDGSTAKR
jgi:hypothetical protein